MSFAAPLLSTREQPQEHSHEKYLRKVNDMVWINNTINAIDPVFGLLTDTDAEHGKGTISDVACLQMATADLAFTNSRKHNDLEGMVASLIYRTLERNTNGVGINSVLCTTMRADNSEIAALLQHQDPAAPGAPDHNRAVVLELARQISLIGGNATMAIEAGTFAPGLPGSGKGNTCNESNCIYEGGRLKTLVSNAEITAYVSQCVATVTVTQTMFNTAPIASSTRSTSSPTSAVPTTRTSSRNSEPNAQTTPPAGTTGPPLPPPGDPPAM